MTSQQLKDQINADITNKTAEASVTAVDVGSNMSDIVTHIDNQIADNVQNNLMPSATKSASVDAVLAGLSSANDYTDDKVAEAITGIFRIAGNYDASVGTFPTTGTGTAGAVRSGDVYIVSVAGTLGGVSYSVNDRFYALVDAPGQTSSNWERFSFNPDEATTTTLGTVRKASDTEVTNGTGDGVVSAEQLQEKLDNLPSGSPDLQSVIENGDTISDGSNSTTVNAYLTRTTDGTKTVTLSADGFILSSGPNNLSLTASPTANRDVVMPNESGTLAIQKYKSYVALISQSGTSAPTATVLQNDFTDTITPSRVNTGRYNLTFSGTQLTANKTVIFITSDTSSYKAVLANRIDPNIVRIETVDLETSAYADGLSNATFEIRVYN